MSLLDGLIFGIRKLFVNGAEQPLKSELELIGPSISVAQNGEKSVVTIAGGSGNLTAKYILAEADATLPNAKVISGSNGIEIGGRLDECIISPTYGTAINTICQGNDARLSDSRRWRQTGPIQIEDSFSGTLPLACMSAPYPIPKVGLPVRFCDMRPICYDDTNGNYSGDNNGTLFGGLTGPLYDYADDAGLIYPSMISDGGGAYHVNFYSDSARTKLFGHTASFSATGSIKFTADNGAALSGTVVIAGTLAASASASLQVYRYGIIDGVVESTGSINWTGVSITGCCGIWIGTPEMVVPIDVSIKGSYAETTSSQALFVHNARKVYWDRPTAHLAYLRAEHEIQAEASQPKIAMVHNGSLVHSDADAMTVVTTRGQSNDAFSADSARRIAFSQPIEMRVQAGTGAAQNLSATAVYILE